MSNTKYYEFIDKRGVPHRIPDGACTICSHCTDIFLDPWDGNRIYLCLCELHEDTTKLSRKCKDFQLDNLERRVL